MAELKRLLLSPKQIITLLMLAVINLALFSGYCRNVQEEQDAYVKIQTKSLRTLVQKASDVQHEEELAYVTNGYYEYLDYVQAQSVQQGILGKLSAKGSFVTRNLEKTAKDYEKLKGIQLTAGENTGIRAVMNYRITDYLLLIAPLLLVLELSAEADSAIGALTRTTKRGRVPLCCIRILSLVILSAAAVLLLYGGNILYAVKTFGDPGLQRAIQSVPDFKYCTVRITVGGYYAAAALMKLAAVTAVTLTFWILFTRFYSFLSWLISVPLLALQYILSTAVVPTSAFNHLKFINVFTALESDVFFTQYCNLNWFGHPSGILTDIVAAMILLLVILTVLTVILIGLLRPVRAGQQLEAVKDRIVSRLSRFMPVHSLFGAEGWKLLFAERALVTAAVCAVFGVMLFNDIHFYQQSVDVQKFYTKYSGEITQEKIDKAQKMLLGEEDKLDHDSQSFRLCMENGGSEEMKNMIRMHIQQDWMYMERYEEFLEMMTTTREAAEKGGFKPYLVNDDSYRIMITENASERRCCMLLLLFLIFSFYAVCAYDNRWDTRLLLRSTRNGRVRMMTAQIAWTSILTALAVTAFHGICLFRLHQEVGFTYPEAMMQNLEMFRGSGFRTTLGGCIALLMVQRFLAAAAITAIIMTISRCSRTPQRALLISMIVFVLPTALAESGLSVMQRFDFVRFLSCCKSVIS